MMRVLIADDDTSLLEQLREILASERYTVDTASNGIEAIITGQIRQMPPQQWPVFVFDEPLRGWLTACGVAPEDALAAARAWALLHGRDHVQPEDVQAVLPAVAGHRLRAAEEIPLPPDRLVRRLIEAVALPG
mgnify:CR=1 FL=1